MYSATVDRNCSVAGKSFPFQKQVTASKHSGIDITVAAAKVGQLTTRTDADTGTLTMDSGHGFTTGVRLDVYWDGGSRRGMTVGTVATNSVPIDGGAGDDLPTNLTAITAAVPTEEDITLDGDDVALIAMFAGAEGSIVLADASDVTILGKAVGGSNGGEQSYVFADGDGTNPVAGGDIAKVFLSHGDSDASQDMRLSLLHD